jgi:hypothetical protein
MLTKKKEPIIMECFPPPSITDLRFVIIYELIRNQSSSSRMSTVMVVRPRNFMFNEETAISNKFQVKGTDVTISARAIIEFDNFVSILRTKGINVIVIDDTSVPVKPDAVFPNNWVTFHVADAGKVLLYPMCAPNRRHERRIDAVECCIAAISTAVPFSVLDLSAVETKGAFMEGTGSMIFDHLNKIIYCCLSVRVCVAILDRVCVELGYTSVVFRAVDDKNFPIYHTNVMLAIGERYAVVCADSIEDSPAAMSAEERILGLSDSNAVHSTHCSRVMCRAEVLASLSGENLVHKREVVTITHTQMNSFAGNMLELFGASPASTRDVGDAVNCDNSSGRHKHSYLMMSQAAYDSLEEGQISRLSAHSELVPIAVPTIETYGGGSIRCMICEVR